jgi:hypothetical protein
MKNMYRSGGMGDDSPEKYFREILPLLSSPDTRIYITSERQRSRRSFQAHVFFDLLVKNAAFLNHTKYVLQRRNPASGQWQTKGLAIHGKTLAQSLLNRQKEKFPNQDWRVVPKNTADAYKQGWLDRDDLGFGVNPAVFHKKRRAVRAKSRRAA